MIFTRDSNAKPKCFKLHICMDIQQKMGSWYWPSSTLPRHRLQRYVVSATIAVGFDSAVARGCHTNTLHVVTSIKVKQSARGQVVSINDELFND